MRNIAQYVDNLFYALPPTEEVRKTQAAITESMEEKYAALIGKGLSEAEAFAQVVEEFGSMEELCREMGLSPAEASRFSPTISPSPEISEEDRLLQKKAAVGTAAGVGCILLSVGFFPLIEILLGEAAAIATFMGILAVGIGLLIYWDQRKQACLPPSQREESTPNNTPVSSMQGIVMLLCTVIFLYIGFSRGLWHPGWIVFIVGWAVCEGIELFAAFSRPR